MKKECVLMLLCVIGATVQAGTIATPHVAGSMQGWDAGANPMVETASGSDIWTATFTVGANERHEFKITDGTWDNSYPGPNSWFYADADGNITITYDGNTYADGWMPSVDRIGLSADTGSWTVAGDFQGWDNTAGNMTPMGGGKYSFSQALTAGEYYFKAVVTGSWDSIGEYDRSINTGNLYANLASDGILNVYVDNSAGTVMFEVVPEPATMALLGLGSLVAIRRKK